MSLEWYWHRFRSMDSSELRGHLRKRLFQTLDSWRLPDFSHQIITSEKRHPLLPDPTHAPKDLFASLKEDADRISGGRWRFFGRQELQVDDPPLWHKDYLVNADISSTRPGFQLNHRQLPHGADIKCVWELSRWYEVARLSQAGWLLREPTLSQKSVCWLENWLETNPPFRGWNWTSALESGVRLIQFAWMDAWLSAGEDFKARDTRLQHLRERLLAPHVHFTWRNRSFGSSANNHLLGELAGLIVACARWPALTHYCVKLETLANLWQEQVLAQFACDGGNREQALNYHLFSWELSHHAFLALKAAGIPISPAVEERLACAAEFFVDVQAPTDAWDYGDSDNAFVVPLMSNEENAIYEWRAWLAGEKSSGLQYWLGRRAPAEAQPGWRHLLESGYSVFRSQDWFLRWDLSALGFLKTAAHGHLDALHLSLWYKGIAIVIDPGTGAYYVDAPLRGFLASRDAHNGPNPPGAEFPTRRGPFLWASQHGKAELQNSGKMLTAKLPLGRGRIIRTLRTLPNETGWEVEDSFEAGNGQKGEFTVLWQFAPGTTVQRLGERTLKLERAGVGLIVEIGQGWQQTAVVVQKPSRTMEGTVSPYFRKTEFAPFVKLTSEGSTSQVCQTTFLACVES